MILKRIEKLEIFVFSFTSKTGLVSKKTKNYFYRGW